MTSDSKVLLSPTLQREILTLSEHPADKSITWSVRYGYRLEKLGLAKRTLLSDRTYLTTLGIEVAEALRSSTTSDLGGE